MMEALAQLRGAGVRVVTVKAPPGLAESAKAQHVTMQSEVASYHAQTFQTRGELFAPALQAFIAEGLRITADQYLQAQGVGMQLIAPHLREQRLIDIGGFCQQSTDWHLQRPLVARWDQPW